MIETLATIAKYASLALLTEVRLTPKPGLVDRLTNGAHHDMTFATFLTSIQALQPFFVQYLETGYHHQGSYTALFAKERVIGRKAEAAMLTATKGINTHKGANFSFAVLLGATGVYLQKNARPLPLHAQDSQQILTIAAQMTQQLIQTDLQNLTPNTHSSHGEQLYLTHGVAGVRGEAAKGYPALQTLLLPFLRENKHEATASLLLRGLLYLMATIEDSNLLHRGGITAWQQVRHEAKKIHQKHLPTEELYDELKRYDCLLTARYLSPGGSADLLALGIYFSFLEGIIQPSSGQKV